MSEQSIFDRIVDWNHERLLIKEPDMKNETSFVVEELLEMNTNLTSMDARVRAKSITDLIVDQAVEPSDEQVLDAAGDAIVFLTGLIRKKGYDPNVVMDEVLKTIESRVGRIIDGKFVKDRTVKEYTPRFELAKI